MAGSFTIIKQIEKNQNLKALQRRPVGGTFVTSSAEQANIGGLRYFLTMAPCNNNLTLS